MNIHFGKIQQIIYFGGGDLLVESLKSVKDKVSVIVVTTSEQLKDELPVQNKSLESCLNELEVPFYLSTDINNEPRLKENISGETLGVSLSARWIFKEPVISLFEGRFVNLHTKNLPFFRGGGGFSWQILMGERKSGATLHLMESGIDTGDIVKQLQYEMPESCLIPRDYDDVSFKKSLELLNAFYKDVLEGKEFQRQKQDETVSTYWPRLSTAKHGYLNWAWSAKDLVRFVRAFDDPYAGAKTFLKGDCVSLKGAEYLEGRCTHPFQAGIVFRITDEGIFIAANHGVVRIEKILDQNQNDIKSSIKKGHRFITPGQYLEAAFEERAIY